MSKQDTIISLLKEIDENIDNVGGIVNVPKVKVMSLRINDACINEDGVWEGESLIDFSECTSLTNFCSKINSIRVLDVSNLDTSKVVSFESFVDNCPNLQQIKGLEDLDVSNATSFFCCFRNSNLNNQKDIDLRRWNMSNVKNLNRFFSQSRIHKLNMEGVNTEKVTDFGYFLWQGNVGGLVWINLVGVSAKSASANMNYCLWEYYDSNREITIVGDYTVDEVIDKNLKVFSDLKISFRINSTNLNRASLRALINGLADLTDQTTQTLTIGETLIAKLTEEDIAIATAKNWTIA